MAENSRASSSKRTRHLNVRYYCITDQKKGHVKVAFCPTQEMIADFFIKPLQGSLFLCMQEKILNLPPGTSSNIHRSVLEMCKNECMKGMDTDDIKDPMKDPTDAGRRNNSGRENKTWEYKTKDKTKINDNARYGKDKKLSYTKTSSRFLILLESMLILVLQLSEY